MSEKNSLFEKLDDISAGQSDILCEIIGVKEQVSATDSRIAELEQEIQKLKTTPVESHSKIYDNTQPKKDNEILQTFLKQSKKSWRWFGSKSKFNKQKKLSIISFIALLILGLISSIVSSFCFQTYSTFTLFENIWLIFGIIYLTYACNTQLIYEVNNLASNSSTKYVKDVLGMMFPRKEKAVFKIFRWLAIISVIANIFAIWTGIGKTIQISATVFEILFLVAIIFSYFANLNLFSHYSIIWVEGRNLTTKEKVVLVLPPGAKQLMPEEEFKKKMPFIYK